MKKTSVIKLRVSPSEKTAFEAVARARGQTASEILRAAITRMVRRADAKQEEGAE